jgi:uncharacterized protein (UPF0210 family)
LSWTRRELLSIAAAGLGAAALPRATHAAIPSSRIPNGGTLRVRTITAGTRLASIDDVAAVERAVDRLLQARERMRDAGFEVQTVRVATNPAVAALGERARGNALAALERLDAVVTARGAILAIGPILTGDLHDPGLGSWAAELVQRTRAISFSLAVSGPEGVRRAAARTAADVIAALAPVNAAGTANFRFAAAAGIPAGTPFFPVAWHEGDDSFAVGLESAGLVHESLDDVEQGAAGAAESALRAALDAALAPVEMLGSRLAADAGVRWLGIDPSPAPGMDRSIGAAIEALTGAPFGDPSTLQACAAITAALKSLRLRTCGYAGLMLPVLEDPVLARRATEGRYGIQELLLYSSVCGTGLDVVPLAGDIDRATLARIVGDVATLAVRLHKPLSVRLLPVPGKAAGDPVSFDDPLLTDCRVFAAS